MIMHRCMRRCEERCGYVEPSGAPFFHWTLCFFLLSVLQTDLSPERAPPSSSALLGAATGGAADSTGGAAGSSVVRSVLLKRLDPLSDQLCMHTLDLLQTLIGLRDPLVINNLVLRNLLVQPAAAVDGCLDASAVVVPALAGAPTDILPIQQFVMFAGFNELPDFAALGAPFEGRPAIRTHWSG